MSKATKARTEGQKRRDRAKSRWKAAEASCPISGVRIAVSEDAPPRASETARAARDEMLARRCVAMGITDSEAHRKMCAGAEWASLHGRAWLWAQAAGQTEQPDAVDEDAYQGIEAYRQKGEAYRRDVLGANVPRHDDASRPPLTPEDVQRLAAEWVTAEGCLTAQGRLARDVVLWVIAAPETVQPRHITGSDRRWLRIAGHQLARQFKLRL
jgi:hypothetical protein